MKTRRWDKPINNIFNISEQKPWQNGGRNTEEFAEEGIPLEGFEVHEHGPAGVGDVCQVEAARQVPEQPRVHGPEQETTLVATRFSFRNVLEQPGEQNIFDLNI